MDFREKRTLQQRGPVDSEPDSEVETFLVSTTCVLRWDSAHSQCGHDSNLLYPAWIAGKRGFMRRSVWQPSRGYSASGTEEWLLSFEEGVALLVEHHVYDFSGAAATAGR